MHRAIPFVPQIKAGRGESAQCAEQLSKLIESHESDSWRFSHLEDVPTLRSNGCLAALSGNSTSMITFQVAIFERESETGR